MDFYITINNGPTKDQPDNYTAECYYKHKEPIKLDGEYEVAVVQSIFKDVHSDIIANINIFPSSQNMDMYTIKIVANDGDTVQTIIQNTNQKLLEMSLPLLENQSCPKILFNEQNLEFKLDCPEDWIYFIMDVDMNYIEKSYQLDNKTYFKFKNHKFYQKRDFYVRSSLLLNESGVEKSPLLATVYIKDLVSNVNQADIQNPQYIEVKNQTLNQFSIEYSTDIEYQSPLKGNIISTLHFRKLNGF